MRKIQVKYKSSKAIKVSFLIVVALCFSSCTISDRKNLQNIVPHQIEIEKEIISKTSGSFDESQGFALYQISQATSEDIMSQGLSFFDDITLGKVDKWPLKDWQVTRGAVDYEWIKNPRKYQTVDIKKWSDKNTYTLYKAETAFGGGIVIIPEIRLVNVYINR